MSEQRIITAGDSIARIDRVCQSFRHMIDTESSIFPCVRGAMHASLDEDPLLARARILDYIAKHEAHHR
ncbi:hypothetical protein ACH79_39405 [Bradyrhizobium sp. CCBAU 051011]|nr:hypothetical protein ACH79_39405 [Bradyrhizobium sp. CCBAU 051011]